MLFHDLLRDAEPETCALSRGFRREERVHDAMAHGLGDPGPRVNDMDAHLVVLVPDVDLDGLFFLSLDRVESIVDQVEENLRQCAGASPHEDLRILVLVKNKVYFVGAQSSITNNEDCLKYFSERNNLHGIVALVSRQGLEAEDNIADASNQLESHVRIF